MIYLIYIVCFLSHYIRTIISFISLDALLSPLISPERRPVNREERPPPRRASSRSTMLPCVLHCMDVSFALPAFSYNTTIQRTKLLFFLNYANKICILILIIAYLFGIFV